MAEGGECVEIYLVSPCGILEHAHKNTTQGLMARWFANTFIVGAVLPTRPTPPTGLRRVRVVLGFLPYVAVPLIFVRDLLHPITGPTVQYFDTEALLRIAIPLHLTSVSYTHLTLPTILRV